MAALSLSKDAADPSVILVLTTGLPAAGKSSFLAAAQQHVTAQPGMTFPLFGGARRGRVAAVFRLDDVLRGAPQSPEREDRTNGAPSAQATRHASEDASFSPARWKHATQSLFHLTEEALRTCLRDTRAPADVSSATVDIPFVFVEDNLHLRSMRERFYRLCRRLELEEEGEDNESSEAPDVKHFIAMLELRFVIPLEVCLERNALRLHAPQCDDAHADEGAVATRLHSSHVPPAVIVSMHALFDHSRDPAALSGPSGAAGGASDESTDASSEGWWRWTSSTQPWSLLELAAPAAEEGLQRWPTAAALVSEFFTRTLQERTRIACDAQRARVGRQRQRRRHIEVVNELARQQRSAARVHSHAHDLDLQLRAVVHLFLQEQQVSAVQAANSPQQMHAVGVELSRLKKQAMLRFKEECCARRCAAADDDDDEDDDDSLVELHETCLMQFQQSLASLTFSAK